MIKWSLFTTGFSGMTLVEYMVLSLLIADKPEGGAFWWVRFGLALFVLPVLFSAYGYLLGSDLRVIYFKSTAMGALVGLVFALFFPGINDTVFNLMLGGMFLSFVITAVGAFRDLRRIK